ncbi:hypothetical protein KJA17_00275 [Patescibacteria group bacterium]|nr:hypothetical protein [Patescibacteria group bacterium]
MKNLRENILLKVPKICEDEEVDPRIFDARAGPQEDSEEMKKAKKKIREGYSEFLTGISFHLIENFYNHNWGYPKEVVKNMEKVIERCFEGGFKNYLRDMKERYPEEIWKIRKEN